MALSVGETVVYPHHGAAVVEDISTRIVRGEERTYLTLRAVQGDLVIQVPASNVELVGMRDVVNEDGLRAVFDTLEAQDVEEPSNWSRRYKANQEKIASGEVLKVAEVVRDLSHRGSDRGLSAGEKRMLTKARSILVSELSLAMNSDEEAAEKLLEERLGLDLDSVPETDDPELDEIEDEDVE